MNGTQEIVIRYGHVWDWPSTLMAIVVGGVVIYFLFDLRRRK